MCGGGSWAPRAAEPRAVGMRKPRSLQIGGMWESVSIACFEARGWVRSHGEIGARCGKKLRFWKPASICTHD